MRAFRLAAPAVLAAAFALACGGGGSSAVAPPDSGSSVPPPDAPAGVTAAAVGAQVTVSWTAVATASSYVVFRATAVAGPFTTQVGTSTAPPFLDSGLGAGETGYYVVQAIGPGGSSADSTPPATATTAPGAVAGLQATLTPTGASAATVALIWTATRGAASYDVQRGSAAAGPFGAASNVAEPAFSDSVTGSGADFFYVVTAKNGAGAGPASAALRVTTPPVPPGNVTATGFNGRVVVSWSAAAGATGYALFRTTTPGSGYAQVGGTVAGTSATDSTVSNATTYAYAVSSVGAGGTGARSTPDALATPLRELCVVNAVSGTVAVFNADQDGDGAPLRTFGSLTRLGRIQSLAIDESTSDIYALDQGEVLVFPATNNLPPSGNIAPARTLQVSPGAVAIAIDRNAAAGPELMVASYDQGSCKPGDPPGCNQLSFYPLGASGAAAPTHTLPTPMPSTDPAVFFAALDPVRRFAFTAGKKIVQVWNLGAVSASPNTIAPALGGLHDEITALAWDATAKKASDSSRLLLAHVDLFVSSPVTHLLSFDALAQSSTAITDVPLSYADAGVYAPSALAVDNGDLSGPKNASVFVFDYTGGLFNVPLPLPTVAGASYQPKFRIGGTHSTQTVFTSARAGAVSGAGGLAVVGDKDGALAVFDISTDATPRPGVNEGDIAPLSHLDGLDTFVFQPSSFDVDPAHDDLVLVNGSPNEATQASVSTYARTAQGDAVPALRLAGPAGGETFVQAVVDDADNLFAFTAQGVAGHLSVFSRTQTVYAPPTDSLPLDELPQDLAYDFAHHLLLAFYAGDGAAVGPRVVQYALTGGALTVAGTLQSGLADLANGRKLAVDAVHGELVVLAADAAGAVELLAFPLPGPAGATPVDLGTPRPFKPNASSGNASVLPVNAFGVDPVAGEWFLSGQVQESSGAYTDGVAVFSRTATSGAPPLRKLGGTQTQLSGPSLLRVCN